ncbi:MAG: site-specific integrase [Desulfomicrobium sp.]|nr:site-specific integrase [Pseudomonadota bacterium]MBV1711776.1 site-specific integrase [Desulfomicrobium sp.]MBU4572636.1 site-specific integrase [Pseudomonadota bacterium]MBU4593583.1 site-specific integrase [Pseudomonadota bacterium]MBV1719162.1 site-specific integrase [Desulfomicrobium sp.]
MPVGRKRIKAEGYNGVFLVDSVSPASGEPDQIIYIRYKLDGKLYEEKVGRTSEKAPKPDHKKFWSPSLASLVRANRMQRKAATNAQLRAEKLAAKEAKEGRWTVGRIFKEYQDAHPDQASMKAWVSIFNTHILPSAVSGKTPDELVTLDIERLRRDVAKSKHKRTGKPLSDQTVKHVLSLLKRILRWAADANHIQSPVHLKFKMPSVDNESTESMTPEQASAYFQALDREADQDAAAYFRFMLLTGIRKSALLALRWEDVDLDRAFLVLRGQAAKSGKTQSIPLSPGAVEVLKGITRTDSPFIWPGKDGAQRADFQRTGRRLRDKAGLPKNFRPCHGLRHCFASWLASSGQVDLYTLQRLLTHGSSAMTQRYAHLADDALKRAVAVADSIMDSGQGENVVEINGKR